MKGRRLLSILLSLLMVITLMPMDSVEVHADSGRKKCVHCDEWVDEGDYCEDCASDHLCCCSSCYDFFHCGFCGGCYLNCDVEPCDENCFNAICVDCAEQEGYHCPECHECYQGDEDALCGNCFRCPECCEICEDCGWCFECLEHCPECGSCDYEDEKCEYDGEHCKECCILCDSCDECMVAKEQEQCEYCGLCEDCCQDNSCDACGMCAENPEYEDHICENCGTCFSLVDQCETCGLCVDCCIQEAENMGCECGGFCHEEVDDDHICDNCGQCFGIVDRSTNADAEGLCLCEDCYEDVIETLEENGGEHKASPQNTWSVDSNYHWHECKFCDSEEHVSNKKAHTFDQYGVCRICGYKDGSKIYITKQPKHRAVDISANDTPKDEKDKAYVSVKAYADGDLTYEWQYKEIGSEDTWSVFADGEAEGIDTPTLIYTPKEGDCHNLDGYNHNILYVRCRISDGKNVVYTNKSYIAVQHNYEPNASKKTSENGHAFKCVDKTCEAYGDTEKHKFGLSTWNNERTERTAKCEICGYEKKYHSHKHETSNFHLDEAVLTNAATDEWTAEVDGYEFIVDERHHEGICDVEGIGECGVYISEAHKWKPWECVHATPKKEGEHGGIFRTCSVCEYVQDDLKYDENGEPLYWEFGTHPVSIIGGSSDDNIGLIRDGQTISLIPDKKEDHIFNGWKIEYERINIQANPNNNYYETIEASVTYDSSLFGMYVSSFHLSNDLKTFTMPNMKDAGKWIFTAIYKEGCEHKKTELSGQMEATCGHMGYTGDLVCSDCGKVIDKGVDIDRLEHKHTHLVEESVPIIYKNGKVAINPKTGEEIYKYRTHELGDCVKKIKSYSGDIICDDCGQIVEKGQLGSPEHDWEVLSTGAHYEATVRSKGMDYCRCKNCGMEKNVVRDYSGPDYTVVPSRKNIKFNYEFGKKPEPIVIDYKRTGRNADEIVKIIDYEFYVGYCLDAEITGDMQITITPKCTNYLACDPDEILNVTFITKDGTKVDSSSFKYSQPNYGGDEDPKYDESVYFEFGVKKSKEKYKLTVLNGEIFEDGTRNIIGNTDSYHVGDYIVVKALNDELKEKFGKDCFVEWEVVSDDSGMLNTYFSGYTYSKTSNEIYITMPNNDVVIRAVIKHEHEFEYSETIAPTANEKGYDSYKCKYCSEELRKNEKPALGNTNDDSKTSNKDNKDNKKKISLRQVKLNKLKAKKKGIKVSWKKLKGADGYQIQYSLNKKFKKGKKFGTKKVLVKKGKTVKKVLKKLKSKKTYFVRIRAYKIVDGKKKFGPWSKKKKVKVK